MSIGAAAPASRSRRFQRRIGHFSGTAPGPTVVVCGGLHGNEPAGAFAAERVAEELERLRPEIHGEIVFVAGNLEALERRQRYVEWDLNRIWTAAQVDTLRAQDPSEDRAEQREQRELLAIFDEAAARARGGVVVLDLHTTSSRSPPFTIMSDTLRNRRVAFALSGPVILGLEESVDGTLLEYMTECGHTAVVVESGQHAETGSIDRHEAVIWISLVAEGVLAPEDVPDLADHRRTLAEANGKLPRVVELQHRHAVENGAGFRMRPGFLGFARVDHGQVLAHDAAGEIVAPQDGLLLMPLYQEQGDDGFFIVVPVNRMWLALSAMLRRLRMQWVLPLLPGISRHPTRPRALQADTHVARWFVVDVLHLFGYRRRRPEGSTMVFTRRRPG